MEQLSKSAEDYLEAIYELSLEREPVKSVDVAFRLKVTKASVNKALQTLVESNLIEHSRYGRINLTEAGKSYGQSIYERHLMLKDFLVEQLGVRPEVAEFEACEMEHAISYDTMQKWMDYLKKCSGCKLPE